MRGQGLAAERGFAMAALLVGLSVMAVLMSMALPAWRTMAQREREAELVFRGRQIARAVAKYQAARGGYPASLDVLVNEKFLRKKYTDPITNEEFDLVRVGATLPGQAQTGQAPQTQSGQTAAGQPLRQPGQAASGGFNRVTRDTGFGGGGPIIGVVSKSTGTALRVVDGKTKYNEMPFTAAAATTQAGQGARGTPLPGAPGGRGIPGPGGRGVPAAPIGGRGLPMPGTNDRLQLPGRGGR